MAPMAPLSIPTLFLSALVTANDAGVTVGPAERDKHGFLVHTVKSPYQAGTTHIRVLLPDKLEKDKRYPVIFVLPVEAGMENRFGDGLVEIQRRDLHNKYQAIFVAPTFSHLPWYADHPSKADIRQETYLLQVVLPFVEKTYPVIPGSRGRLLLGFSKSGWGAFSLLLRHSTLFGKAAAWDAPLMMLEPNRYGMGDIFGTQANSRSIRSPSSWRRMPANWERANASAWSVPATSATTTCALMR